MKFFGKNILWKYNVFVTTSFFYPSSIYLSQFVSCSKANRVKLCAQSVMCKDDDEEENVNVEEKGKETYMFLRQFTKIAKKKKTV